MYVTAEEKALLAGCPDENNTSELFLPLESEKDKKFLR